MSGDWKMFDLDLRICPYAHLAPHGCGLVNRQVIYDENGKEVGTYQCTRCAKLRAQDRKGKEDNRAR